ncbi:MAG: GAF domain-containing protein [Ferruginibacter sp.]
MSTLREKERIQTLKRYEILDTPPDRTFDRITSLAAKVFKVPIALISLVDQDRIWFKSHEGFQAEQIEKEPGFCSSAILSDEIYIIEDARNDPRTFSHPLVVSEFGLQFYAAVTLRTKNGFNLGTFCIIDKNKKILTGVEKEILKDFAGIAMDVIELQLSTHLLSEQKNAKLKNQKISN